MPIEGDEPTRGLGGLADGGRLQQPFEEREHDNSHKGVTPDRSRRHDRGLNLDIWTKRTACLGAIGVPAKVDAGLRRCLSMIFFENRDPLFGIML
jgi:hypothetical protein